MNLSALDHVGLGGILILLAALALSVSGLSLVLYSAQLTREAVTRRVDLIRGKAGAVARTVAATAPLIRTHQRGFAEREVRAVERMIAKYGIAPRHAGNVLVGVRLVTAAILALTVFVPPRCLVWVATASRGADLVFLGSAESRFSAPA
jgi:hypothetical protein